MGSHPGLPPPDVYRAVRAVRGGPCCALLSHLVSQARRVLCFVLLWSQGLAVGGRFGSVRGPRFPLDSASAPFAVATGALAVLSSGAPPWRGVGLPWVAVLAGTARRELFGPSHLGGDGLPLGGCWTRLKGTSMDMDETQRNDLRPNRIVRYGGWLCRVKLSALRFLLLAVGVSLGALYRDGPWFSVRWGSRGGSLARPRT